MEEFREKKLERKVMKCGTSDESLEELRNKGWESAYSYHERIPEQWDMACDEVEKIRKAGGWEVVKVGGQSEPEKRDTVAYIYKRRINQE